MTGGQVFEDVFYTAPDGLRLHARSYGSPTGGSAPVVCLPGLSRNVRDFHELALGLCSDRQVVSFDYRGRGQSQYDPDWRNYQVATEAADIVAGLLALGIEDGVFVGTSRGGLIIHVLAAMRPSLLRGVVLNDVGPVLEAEGLAHIRAYLGKSPMPATFAEAVAIQRSAHGADFPALADLDWERMVRAIYRDDHGTPVADFDPALPNVMQALNLDEPLPDLWPQFELLRSVPLLAIRGANSRLLSPATLAEMASRHPDCSTVLVEGQGHAPMLETGSLPDVVRDFVARAERR